MNARCNLRSTRSSTMFLLSRREFRFPKKYSDVISDGVARMGFSVQIKSLVPSSFIATKSYSFSTYSQNFFSPALSQQSREHHFRSSPLNSHSTCRRPYFTNGKVTKDRDPYALLGLNWGDGYHSRDKGCLSEKSPRVTPRFKYYRYSKTSPIEISKSFKSI